MVDLRKFNGGGATECCDNDITHQRLCDYYDFRHRSDGAQYCFRFRDFGHGFWVCNCVARSPIAAVKG